MRLTNTLIPLAVVAVIHAALATGAFAQMEISTNAKPWPQVSREGTSAYVDGNTLWLKLNADTVKSRKAVMPRLCAPIRSIGWKDHPNSDLTIRPAQQEWTFSWKSAPDGSSVIEVVFDSTPFLTADCPIATPAGDGSVMLHAWQAMTFGEKILFEPQWYKNTVGYWAIDSDFVTWKLKIDQPGMFSVAVLQGCGKGQGGSDAVVTLRQDNSIKAELPFQTIDTGHFQNFRWNALGKLELENPGVYQLRIDARRIAKVALFDVRMIHLVRQAASEQE